MTGRGGHVVEFAVSFARATRAHRDVRMGSSVRGAIDLVLLLDGLTRLRGETAMTRETARDAAHAALSGRIRIADGCDRSPESVLDELLADLWPADRQPRHRRRPIPRPAARDGQGKADGPPDQAGRSDGGSRSSLRRERHQGPARRTVSRAELASRHAGFADVSPEVGELDADALAGLLAADPDAAAALLADLSQATDPRAARRRAPRWQPGSSSSWARPGASRPAARSGSARCGRGDGDIDLDQTIDRLQAHGRRRPTRS